MTIQLTKQLEPRALLTPSTAELARILAAQGYGVDDLVVKLNIPRVSARWFVFGKEKTAK
jgi:hypothetical protein